MLGNTQMKFILPVPNSGSFSRSNGVQFDGPSDSQAARGFQCYVANPPIECFDFIVLAMTNDPLQPFSEYLMPIPSGYAVWSEISRVSNPSIVTNQLGEVKFNKNLDILEERTAMGHRRDMLVCNSKSVSNKV